MFCRNCGTQLDDSCIFCDKCGTKTEFDPNDTSIESNNYQDNFTPEYQQKSTYDYNVNNNINNNSNNKVGKNRYFFSIANAQTKTFALLVWFLALASIGTMILGYFSLLKTPFHDVPVVSKFLDNGDIRDEYESIIDDLEESCDDIISVVYNHIDNNYHYVLTKRSSEEITSAISAFEKFIISPSYNNAKNAMEAYERIDENVKPKDPKIMLYNTFTWLDDISDSVKPLFKIIPVSLIALISIAGLCILLGSFLRNIALTITGSVLSLVFTLPFCSIALLIISIAINLSIILMQIYTNISYKHYCKSNNQF